MPKLSTIQTYVTVLFLQTVIGCGLFFPVFGSATNCRWYPSFYIFRAEDGIHIYSSPEDDDAISAWFDDPKLIDLGSLTLWPTNKVGPVEGIFEFYHRQSLLSSPNEYRWKLDDLELTESELNFVHQELIAFAQNDSYLSKYQPGAPARIEFLPAATLFSLTKVGTYFGLPALLTWLIGYFKTNTKKAIAQSRRAAGLCIHCTYDCRGLPTPTCPECGKSHESNSSVARLAEPGS